MKKTLKFLILASVAVSGFAVAEDAPQTTTVDKVLAAQGNTTAEALSAHAQEFVIPWVIQAIVQSFYKLRRLRLQTLPISTVSWHQIQRFQQKVRKKPRLP